jgi:hypothetical protein
MLFWKRWFSIEISLVRKKIYLAKMARAAVKHPFSGLAGS